MKIKGEDEFNHFYKSIFLQRWNSLQRSLKKPVSYILRKNKFSHLDEKFIDQYRLTPSLICNNCYQVTRPVPSFLIDQNNLKSYYLMDPASIIPLTYLSFRKNQQIADFCSAPGGKMLFIAEHLQKDSYLHVNDISKARLNRLKNVIKDYLPSDQQKKLKVYNQDASKFGIKFPEKFDIILLDAPCSSERHLISKPELLNNWTNKRSKKTAIKQYALLSAAFYGLKPGGTILYSTCSISSFENDNVIDKLIKRHKDNVCLLPIENDLCEATKNGNYILPDKTGYGPIFFTLISKKYSIPAKK